MSGVKTLTQPDTVDRFLSAIGKKLKGKDADADKISTHYFKELYKNNLVPLLLEKYKPHFYTLPTSIEIVIDVEFDVRDKDFEYLQSVGIAPFVQGKAKELVELGLPPVVQKLRRAEGMVALGYIKEADFIAEIEEDIGELETKVCKEMGPLLEQSAKAYVKAKHGVTNFKLRSAGKIVQGVISIVGSIAHAATSWGATSPLAIVSIARSCISIAETIGELSATANQMVVLIDFDFKVLDEIITTAKDSDVPAALKLKNDAKEVGLALLGEIVGLKLPS
jgi:hypothetical protein